tara:strand:- start:1407 stop:1637 length:231 start_codon:yes stop_codon:yes gene_type:complete
MNTVKYFASIIFFISIIFPQENNFDKSIKDTEKQINELKNSIQIGNEEVKKLQINQQKQRKSFRLLIRILKTQNLL